MRVSAVVDKKDGTYTATLTSEQEIDPAAIQAFVTVGGEPKPIGLGQEVRFTRGSASAKTSSFDVSRTAVSTDDAQGVSVTIRTKDVMGRPVAGQVTVDAPHGALIKTGDEPAAARVTVPTNDQGEATVAVLSATPGTFTISAELGGTPLKASNDVATFVVGAPSAGHSTFTVSPDPASSTQPATDKGAFTGTVTVRDAHDVAVPKAPVTLQIPAGLTATVDGSEHHNAGSAGMNITATADDKGQVVVTYTTRTASAYAVAALVNSAERVGDEVTLTFVSTAVDPHHGGTGGLSTVLRWRSAAPSAC